MINHKGTGSGLNKPETKEAKTQKKQKNWKYKKSAKHKKIKQVMVGILIFTIVSTLCVLLLEIILRLTGPSPPKGVLAPDDQLCYTFKGSLNDSDVLTNSGGFPSIEFNKIKDKNTFRIILLGDSFTYGRQNSVGFDETFSELLKKYLSQKYSSNSYANNNLSVEVYNFGVPSYSPYQYSLLAKRALNEYSPDLIIVNFYVNNDFIDETEDYSENPCEATIDSNGFMISKQYHSLNWFIKLRIQLAKTSKVYSLVHNALADKYLVRKLLYKLGLLADKAMRQDLVYFQKNNFPMQKFEYTTKLLETIAIETKNNNTQLIITLIPDLMSVNDAHWNRIVKEYELNASDYDPAQPFTMLMNFCKTKQITCLNLRDDFYAINKNENIYYGKQNHHYIKKGHEAHANAIFLKITELKLIEKTGISN